MNPEKTREAIKVMEAYAEGKQIQVKNRDGSHDWYNVKSSYGETPSWDWDKVEYRVAPPIIAPVAPEEYWIVLAKGSMTPIGVAHLSSALAEKWVSGAYKHHYEIVHVKPVVKKVRPEKWKVGDEVVLARLSTEKEYDAKDGPGWDDEISKCLGTSGVVRHVYDDGSVSVRFESLQINWALLAHDLDPA